MGSYFLNHFTHRFCALRNPEFRIAFCVPQQRGDQQVTFINLLLIACMPGLRGLNALSHVFNEVKTKTCQPRGRGGIIRGGWGAKLSWLPLSRGSADWSVQPQAGEGTWDCSAAAPAPPVSQGTVYLQNILLVPGPSWEEQRCQQQELTSLADEQTLNRSPAPRI